MTWKAENGEKKVFSHQHAREDKGEESFPLKSRKKSGKKRTNYFLSVI